MTTTKGTDMAHTSNTSGCEKLRLQGSSSREAASTSSMSRLNCVHITNQGTYERAVRIRQQECFVLTERRGGGCRMVSAVGSSGGPYPALRSWTRWSPGGVDRPSAENYMRGLDEAFANNLLDLDPVVST